MPPAVPRRRNHRAENSPSTGTRPRRLVVAVLACAGLLLSMVVATGPAGADTVPWSEMSIVRSTPAATAAVPWTQMSASQKESAMVYAMLALLNQERAAYHLSPVYGNAALGRSSGNHTLVMASDNLMSHQCPGEADPGVRIRNAGYAWHSWGENVGWTTDESINGILTMERMMFNEVPPNDGHRVNILSGYRNIGISVYFDNVHHKAWYTQDFAS